MIPSSSLSKTTNTRSDSIPRSRDAAATSNIRPRNKRLGTLESQELGTTSATSTPSGSRAVSPIPAQHPSRSRTSTLSNGGTVGGRLTPDIVGRDGRGNWNSGPTSGLWNTGWLTSLQQAASSVLGSVSGDDGYIPRTGTLWGTTGPAKQWGPSSRDVSQRDSGIGTGSTTEREAEARAKKMRRVLEGRDELQGPVDTSGNYKRRMSSDEQRPGSEQEEHALVYVHHVQPQDTFAGIVLRYNCPREVFRKANGLWNDALGFRKTVVLPVDACAVKGRPCEPPSEYGVDLLAPTPGLEESPFPNGNSWPSTQNETSAERLDDDRPWSHVRWVLIESSPSSKPVEIARMPRKTLGYFPPRRRRSITAQSALSTPRGSLDLNTASYSASQTSADLINSPASTPGRRTSNLGARPLITSQTIGSLNSAGSYFPPVAPIARTRSRRESVSETAERLGWMTGPGGVGTLGKNVRKPGPGNDGLNKWAKRNLPGISIDSLPSQSIQAAEVARFGFDDELTAIAESSSNDQSIPGTATPSGLGIENAAAVVEGFFRKLAVKPGTPMLRGKSDTSDLIELLDGTGSDDGFELNRSRTPGPGGGTLREDLEGVIRGRSSARAKGGKGD